MKLILSSILTLCMACVVYSAETLLDPTNPTTHKYVSTTCINEEKRGLCAQHIDSEMSEKVTTNRFGNVILGTRPDKMTAIYIGPCDNAVLALRETAECGSQVCPQINCFAIL